MGDRPSRGQEIENDKLAADMLQAKTEFTEDEWSQFGITVLREHDFIKAGSAYYQAEEVQKCSTCRLVFRRSCSACGCIHSGVYTCMHACAHVCGTRMAACMRVCLHVSRSTRVLMCRCVDLCACVHSHTHTHTQTGDVRQDLIDEAKGHFDELREKLLAQMTPAGAEVKKLLKQCLAARHPDSSSADIVSVSEEQRLQLSEEQRLLTPQTADHVTLDQLVRAASRLGMEDTPSGLTWLKVHGEKAQTIPGSSACQLVSQSSGRQLVNSQLTATLQAKSIPSKESRVELTFQEWDDLGVKTLRMDHFVVIDSTGDRFKPAFTVEKLAADARGNEAKEATAKQVLLNLLHKAVANVEHDQPLKSVGPGEFRFIQGAGGLLRCDVGWFYEVLAGDADPNTTYFSERKEDANLSLYQVSSCVLICCDVFDHCCSPCAPLLFF